jgi:hypothetical protein
MPCTMHMVVRQHVNIHERALSVHADRCMHVTVHICSVNSMSNRIQTHSPAGQRAPIPQTFTRIHTGEQPTLHVPISHAGLSA